MATSVSVLLGPARSGKTTRLVSMYRRVLEGREFGRGLWLAPTHRAADEVRARLVTGGHGLAGRGGGGFAAFSSRTVYTFAHFAEIVVQRSPLAVRPIDAAGKRQFIGRLIDEQKAAGKLVHFASIANKPGLVDLVAGLFADLKRAGDLARRVFRGLCAAGPLGEGPRAGRTVRCISAPVERAPALRCGGSFLVGAERLRKGEVAPFDAVTTVVVDGFTDFTRTQHEILEILAGRAKEVVITLPWDEAGGERSDLFQKCRSTLAELERRHPGLRREIVQPQDGHATSGTLAHLERNLFKDPRRIEPAAAAPGVEIIGAGGQLGELEAIARVIKQLLVEGDAGAAVRPADIVVVFRSTADVAPLVDEVFSEFGIPASIEARVPLARADLRGVAIGVAIGR